MHRIPVYQPSLKGNERKYVLECLDSTWISSKGRFVQEFEGRFADYVGVRHASSVTNGTVALHLALIALGIGPGDEVIVPTLTYVASVNAIVQAGAKPVFVDSLHGTWQVDPEDIARKITPRTRALMVVHLYGHPCDMDTICSIAAEHALMVIEDCAEAFGSLYKGRHVGQFGQISTFSFFGNKTITTGEGGMVVTNDLPLFKRAQKLKSQGVAPGLEYWHDELGYNYRMTNICAAIGLAQLERADELIAKKRQVAGWYRDELRDAPVVFQSELAGMRHSQWMVSMLVADGRVRDALRERLSAAGIETRPLFHPIHALPMYSTARGGFPVAESISARGLNLPSYPDLDLEQVAAVCAAIRESLEAVASGR